MAQELQGKPCLATRSVPTLWCAPASLTHPPEMFLCLGASSSPASPQEALHSCRARLLVPSALGKSSMAQEHQSKTCPATRGVPTMRCTPASPACPWDVLFCLGGSHLHPPTLRKHFTSAKKASQHCPPLGRATWPKSIRARPPQQGEVYLHCSAYLPVPTALRKCSFALEEEG